MSTKEAELRPVTTRIDAEFMRGIRNECRFFMTNDTSYISSRRQMLWWAKVISDPSLIPYLMWVDGHAAGYGVIRIKNHMWWVTGGLLQKYRGQGLGRKLFRMLTDVATDGHAAYLEVQVNNDRAINLYQSLGYRYIEDRDALVWIMKADPR